MEDDIKSEAAHAEELPANLPILEEMAKAGLFVGHKKSKTHPLMRQYVYGVRNGIALFDLPQTLTSLEKAMEFMQTTLHSLSGILVVGNTPAAKQISEALAQKFELPHVTERWLGGTLTNFNTLAKRISYFKKLKADKAAGRLDKYTKKERLGIDREIAKLHLKFSGVEFMEKLPEVVFIVDLENNMIAAREARKMHIPVVAIANTNADPRLADYLIPANDRSRTGLEWIFAKLETVLTAVKQKTPQQTAGTVVK